MFIRFDIHLTEPICACKEQNLSWAIDDKKSLTIACKNCDVKILVPYKQFKAHILCKTPYPEKSINTHNDSNPMKDEDMDTPLIN